MIKKKRTVEQTKKLLIQLVNGKFYFDEKDYKNAKSNIKFTCKNCNHVFYRTLGNYKRSNKCPQCEGRIHKHTTKGFLEKVKEVWGDKLDLSKVVYKTIDDKVTLKCNIHNKWFEQIAYEVLQGKHTCKECASKNASDKQIKDLEYYQNKVDSIFPNKFEVLKHDRILRRHSVKCLEHNTIFDCHISHLYKGHISCKECKQEKRGSSDNTFIAYYDKPTWLYYIRFTNKGKYYYKIGITTKDNTIKERFRAKEFREHEPLLLLSTKYLKGEDAYKEELRYLNLYKEYKVKRKECFLPNGNTEVFNKDVFNIDKLN